MTLQSSEILEYRGKEYQLSPYPLEVYLEYRKDLRELLNIVASNSDLWRGYQGFWKIRDDKLYLTKIESSFLTIEGIFNSSQPIFANWYSGILNMGFGKGKSDDFGVYYENYLWMKVDNGIIINRKIIKRPIEIPLSFGKYKGKTPTEIIKGKIKETIVDDTLFKEYICEITRFLIDASSNFKVVAPYIPITQNIKDFVRQLKVENINFLLSKDFLAIEKNHYINIEGEEDSEHLSLLLEKLFSTDFTNLCIYARTKYQNGNISDKTLFNPDPDFITNAINKLSDFTIPPHILVEKRKLKKLKRFDIKRLNSTIFEYKPVIQEFEFLFPSELIITNSERFLKKYNLVFDMHNNIYTPNLSKEELFNQFGFYLDESYETKSMKKKRNPEYTGYYEKLTYNEYFGSYAQDIEHISDQVIGDAFEGDPINYWNID